MKDFVKKIFATVVVIVVASAIASVGIVGWFLSINDDAGTGYNDDMVVPVVVVVFIFFVIAFSMYTIHKYSDKRSNETSVYYGFASTDPKKRKASNRSYTFLAVLQRRIRRRIREKRGNTKAYAPRHLSASSFDLPL